MAEIKDFGIGHTSSPQGHSSGVAGKGAGLFEKKRFFGKDEAESPPSYEGSDYERRASVNLSGVQDRTHRKLKARHIQLIGIGGTIGTALYVQIGRGLLQGGPASLFMAFTIWYTTAAL
jgi:amino acid permease